MISKKVIYPETLVEIVKLWPWARSKGHFIGQIWEIGFYSKREGLDSIWLCDDKERRYAWLIDRHFFDKFFMVKKESKNRNLYMPSPNSRKRWIALDGEIIIGRKRSGIFLSVH
jgi:hypothetical protein